MKTKKRRTIKSKEVKRILQKGGRKGSQKDFFELIKRAAKSPYE